MRQRRRDHVHGYLTVRELRPPNLHRRHYARRQMRDLDPVRSGPDVLAARMLPRRPWLDLQIFGSQQV